MTTPVLVQLLLYLVLLLALVKPLGTFMAKVYEGEALPLGFDRVLGPIERSAYRLAGVRPQAQMAWREYTVAMLVFNVLGLFVVYALQRLQAILPLNPEHLPAVAPDLAFNTAVSFITNTNWQSYGGEMTMGYFVQMAALTVQNFVSAATGMAALVAFIRGLRSQASANLGNFWADLVRTTVYILIPLSVVLALVIVSQGAVQTFAPYAHVRLVQAGTDSTGAPVTEQVIALGPAASQIAIKQLGTNGGGFFNVNSAHPFENPTPLSNFWEMLAILLIPAALCYAFGRLVGDTRQGWAILAAMTLIFVVALAAAVWAESQPNPHLAPLGVNAGAAADQSGGNMEGKDVRLGIGNSALWATATTAASNGSVNAMHDSFMPLGGLVPLFLIQLGEVIFGGVGSGLYGMLVFAIITVFIAGLMVGRTPEYLGKKIEAYEMKMASLVILIPPLLVLGATAMAIAAKSGGTQDPGAHGFSEILYAYSSMGNNNGSAFAGFTAAVPFTDTLGAIVMFIARFWLAVPALAIAGSLAKKRVVLPSAGTLPTHTPLFVGMLIGVVLIVGALTFFPALALGPIVEQLSF